MSPIEGPRPGRPEDYDAIITALDAIFRIGAGRAPTIAIDWPHVYADANIHNACIMTDGGRVVASATVWPTDIELGEVRLRVGGISCVGVLPEYRQHGLGAQVMAAVHRRMQDLGCHVGLLSTDIDNWYRSLGWERAGMRRTYRVDRGNVVLLPDLPVGVAMRQGDDDDLPIVLDLHAAGRLGAIRSVGAMRQILTSPVRRATLSLAEQGTRTRAYILTWDMQVVEWGGDAEVIAGMVKNYFMQSDDESVSASTRDAGFKPVRLQSIGVRTPARGHQFIDVLDLLGVPYALDYMGMMYTVDANAIVRAYGLADRVTSEQGEWFSIEWEGRRHTFSRRSLTKLLFGPERPSVSAPDDYPLPFWQWRMELV